MDNSSIEAQTINYRVRYRKDSDIHGLERKNYSLENILRKET